MFESVIVYFFTFLISCLSAKQYMKYRDIRKINDPYFELMVSRYNKQGKRKLIIYKSQFYCLFWAVFVFVPPLIIATFRDNDVGSDTATYYMNYVSYAKYNLNDYTVVREHRASAFESGFQQLMHWGYITKIGFPFVKFASEFLILFFLWQGLKYYHKTFKIDMSLFLFFYFLFEFSYGLNGTRFAITLSIFFYSFQYVIEKKFVKYVLCCMLMTLFHQTMIVCVPFYLINAVDISLLKYIKKYLKWLILIFMFVFVFGLKYIIALFLPIVRRISARLSVLDLEVSNGFGIGVFVFIFLFLLFPVVYWKQLLKDNKRWLPVLVLSTTYIPFRFLGYFNEFAVRFTRIPEFAICLIFCGIFKLTPISLDINQNNKVSSLASRICIILFSLTQYIIYIIVQKSSEVYPYIWQF